MTGRLALLCALAGAQPAAAQGHLVVISGVGGDPQYSATFHEWSVGLIDAAITRAGFDSAAVTYLAERVDRDPERIDDRSRRENIEAAFRRIASRAGPDDLIFVVLIGHGSTRGTEAMFNLPGPDMSGADFAALLDLFPSQRVAFANLATASGPFVEALSGPRRTVVTATKTGFERNESIFGRFFVQAFGEDGADTDKDERVSVLEAFVFATREVERSYEQEGRLRTEHALIDDNGDGAGSTEPDLTGGDGALASTMFLAPDPGATVAAGQPGDPVLAQLHREKRRLEEQIAQLRATKDAVDPNVYESRLEDLLVELALKNRAIREREGTR